MCIAILLPAFKTIDKKTLLNCNNANPDGFGYAAFIKNELYMRKYVDEKIIVKKIDKFIELREKYLEQPFLVHFRIATHGKISTRCCHPFKINKNAVFCHNGILRYNYGVDRNSLDSDTMMFNKNILQKIEKHCLNDFINGNSQVTKDLLEGYIGSGNKMIFLNKDGHFNILNEKLGIWDKGIWYSNDSYKERVKLSWSWDTGFDNYFYGDYWDNKEGTWKKYTPKNWYNKK